MTSFQKADFVLNETAQVRMAEYPVLRGIFKSFEIGIRSHPGNMGRETVDGAVRYRLVRGWVWAYIVGQDGNRLVYSIIGVDRIDEIGFGQRVKAAMTAVAKNYVPHFGEAAEAADAYRNPK